MTIGEFRECFLLSLMFKNSEKQKTRISAFTHWMCLIHCFNFQLKSMWCWVTLHPSQIHWFSFLSPLGHSHIQNLDIKPFCFYFKSDIFWANSNILMIFRLLFGPLPIPAITCLYYHYRHPAPLLIINIIPKRTVHISIFTLIFVFSYSCPDSLVLKGSDDGDDLPSDSKDHPYDWIHSQVWDDDWLVLQQRLVVCSFLIKSARSISGPPTTSIASLKTHSLCLLTNLLQHHHPSENLEPGWPLEWNKFFSTWGENYNGQNSFNENLIVFKDL